MKRLATIVGVTAVLAAIPLLFTPFSSKLHENVAQASVRGVYLARADTLTPETQKETISSYHKETSPLDALGEKDNTIKGKGPTLFSSLELKQHLPVPYISTGASTDLSDGWKRSALHAISRVEDRYGNIIIKDATKNGLSSKFVTAIIVVESGGDPYALSHVGAKGLMQVMQGAKNDTGITGSLWDPTSNIAIGTAYLAQLRDRYGYQTPDAMAVAYNIGPGLARHMSKSAIQNHPYARRVSFVLNHL